MARTITVYQVYDGEDMAQSDAWFATLKEAREHIEQCYGIPASQVILTNDPECLSLLTWEGSADSGYDVHCTACRIELTGKGICHALTNEPNR